MLIQYDTLYTATSQHFCTFNKNTTPFVPGLTRAKCDKYAFNRLTANNRLTGGLVTVAGAKEEGREVSLNFWFQYPRIRKYFPYVGGCSRAVCITIAKLRYFCAFGKHDNKKIARLRRAKHELYLIKTSGPVPKRSSKGTCMCPLSLYYLIWDAFKTCR